MNGVAKGMLIVLIIIYVVSPIDFLPGPIDDIIVILLGVATQKGIGNSDIGGDIYKNKKYYKIFGYKRVI